MCFFGGWPVPVLRQSLRPLGLLLGLGAPLLGALTAQAQSVEPLPSPTPFGSSRPLSVPPPVRAVPQANATVPDSLGIAAPPSRTLTPLGQPPQLAPTQTPASPTGLPVVDTGIRFDRKNWVAVRQVSRSTPILVMAGHSDSQNMAGSGTSGHAVGVMGARPMQPGISDELYWNLLTAQTIVRIGQQRGLNIQFYDPPSRTIYDARDPRTTWSVGGAFERDQGGYALEIHYDAYGSAGAGSGLIVGHAGGIQSLDDALAEEFGAFPERFRDLGAPKRGVSLLEIGKLEGNLERSLRNPATRDQTLEAIAWRVVLAMERGMGGSPGFDPTPTVATDAPAQSPARPIIRSIFSN